MLRRYFANMRRDAGWRLEMISEALGHKHLDTTIKYLNIVDDELLEASDRFYANHSALYGLDDLLRR
jgi:integrase